MRFLLALRRPPFLALLACALLLLGPTAVRSQQAAPAAASPATAANLPAPGYCPPTATDPACPALLEAYGRVYRELVKKTQAYYAVLGAAFGSGLWIERVGAQSKELVADFVRVKTKADSLGISALGGKLYVDKLQDALTKKGAYEQASAGGLEQRSFEQD